MALLDKTPGAVACGHCRGLGADAPCPYCRRPVCKRCLTGKGCSAPHPIELRLGRGLRLRAVDEQGELGFASFLMNDDGHPRHLASGATLGGHPTRYRELPLRYFGPCAFGNGQLAQRCATYRSEPEWDDEAPCIDVHPLLLLATPTAEGLTETRLLPRPERPLDQDQRLFLTRRHAVIVYAEGFEILPLEAPDDAYPVRLRKVIHGMDVDPELGLVAVGLFDGVAFFSLGDGEHLGTRLLGDGNVCAVALGGGRVAAVGESGALRVFAIAREVPPRNWEDLSPVALRGAADLGAEELDITADGALVALRRKRKDVLAVHLPTGQRQVIGGHTDRVHFVRFIDGGQRLVTADKDNRVMIWPRAEERLITGRAEEG
jgi:hypothetical protein